MKRTLFRWSILTACIVFILLATINFLEIQNAYFNEGIAKKASLCREIKCLEKDLIFVKNYQNEIDFLEERGWFNPKSRLIMGEAIESLKNSLNDIKYIFEPEMTKIFENSSFDYKVTKIDLEIGALTDIEIYSFIQELLDNFPAILIFREVTLFRGEKVNEKSLFALRQNPPPHFIIGKLVLEWVSLNKKQHEK